MKKFGFLLAIGILMMIGLSFSTVVLKNLFNYNSNALQETIIYLHATVFMLGIIYAYWFDKHVRIDIFYQKFSRLKKNRINLFGSLFLLLPFLIIIIYSSFSYVLTSWAIMEASSESGGLPFVYLLKSLILIMPVFLILLVIVRLVRVK